MNPRPESRPCSRCGARVPARLEQCPRCLLSLGAEPAAAAADSELELHELQARLPQFEFFEILGRGGMGVVYRARQPSLDREVAIKILRQDIGDDPAFAERFQREARTLARLDHPNIVRVYEAGEQDGLYYLVLEYVDGFDLRRAMADGGLGPARALEIVPQICEALQFAHEHGVVHRDVKPENLLIDAQGRLKMTDFGLAKILGLSSSEAAGSFALTRISQVMGTPHYMAPEQIEHPQEVDHRADIYSLGVVFYEMLTGGLPLGRFEPPSQKVQVDLRYDEIVLRTLEREPKARYQAVKEVKSDLDGVGSESGIGKPAQSVPDGRPVGRGTQLIALPAFAAAFFLCAWGFNRSTVALAGAAIVPLLIAAWLGLHARSRIPAVSGSWRALRPFKKLDRVASALLLQVLALVALAAAHLAHWERRDIAFDSRPQRWMEPYRDQAHRLVRDLEAFKSAVPEVEVSTMSGSFGGNPYLFPAWMLFGLALLACFLGNLIWIAPLTGRPPPRGLWLLRVKCAGALTLLAVGGLFAAKLAYWSPYVLGSRVIEKHGLFRKYRCEADLEEVQAELLQLVASYGYKARSSYNWSLDEYPSGRRLALASFRSFNQPRAGERWRWTWRGPRRRHPRLQITCVAATSPPEVIVSVDAGLIDDDTPGQAGWTMLFDEIERTLDSL